MSKVTSLESRQPITFAGVSQRVEGAIERAYWGFKARQDSTQTQLIMSERDAFKYAFCDMFHWLREDHK